MTVGGEAVAMEELGPIVINTDGTTARITNWPDMTPAEQEKTRRVIVARNAKRLAKLEAAREPDLSGIWMSSASAAWPRALLASIVVSVLGLVGGAPLRSRARASARKTQIDTSLSTPEKN